MKKIILLCFAIVFMAGITNAQKKKVAVVTFYVNKHIGFEQLGGAASLAAGIASLSEDPNFDLTSVLGDFHDKFFNEYAQAFPFDLLPEADVVGNEQYQAYEARSGETEDGDRDKLWQQYLTYEGYKPMREFIGKKWRNELRMLEIFGDEVDGVMFVYMDYAFVKKAAGFGAGIQAYVRMKLWNKEGKKVFSVSEFATSKKTVPLVAGVPVMKAEKLLPLCIDASEKMMADLNKKLKKIAAKSAKKL